MGLSHWPNSYTIIPVIIPKMHDIVSLALKQYIHMHPHLQTILETRLGMAPRQTKLHAWSSTRAINNLLLDNGPPAVVDTDTFSSHSQHHILSIGQDCWYPSHSMEFSLIHPTNKEQLSILLVNTYIQVREGERKVCVCVCVRERQSQGAYNL